jgi:mRNA interferase HicA
MARLERGVKAIRKQLEAAGFVQVPGGKGSHEKWEKAGHRPVIVPAGHGKEVSPGVARSIAKAIEEAA